VFEYPFAKNQRKYLRDWPLSNRHPAPRLTASMHPTFAQKVEIE
jgi:hypothetical protein